MQEMSSRKRHLQDLRRELQETRDLSREELAKQIRALGFQCLHCGECCCGEENSVVVFPFEIQSILESTALSWIEAVEPPLEGEWEVPHLGVAAAKGEGLLQVL
jgi:hypothetical protein